MLMGRLFSPRSGENGGMPIREEQEAMEITSVGPRQRGLPHRHPRGVDPTQCGMHDDPLIQKAAGALAGRIVGDLRHE